jgi:hypothetical protein
MAGPGQAWPGNERDGVRLWGDWYKRVLVAVHLLGVPSPVAAEQRVPHLPQFRIERGVDQLVRGRLKILQS